MKFLLKISIALIAVVLFQSCSKNNVVSKKKLPHKSEDFLIEQLENNEFQCEWLSAKLGVAFKTDKISDSFKMYVRMRKDSVIWISVTYYSVEAARFLITPDSVKFMDRKNNKYFVGKFNYINEKFNIDLDFNSLQSLILGNGLNIYNLDKLKTYSANGLYQISSIRKHQLKKTSEKGKDLRKKNIAISISLYPETCKVAMVNLMDLVENKSLIAHYTKLQEIENQLAPKEIKLNIIAEKNLEATIDFLKLSINNPLKFSFTVPEKYEKID